MIIYIILCYPTPAYVIIHHHILLCHRCCPNYVEGSLLVDGVDQGKCKGRCQADSHNSMSYHTPSYIPILRHCPNYSQGKLTVEGRIREGLRGRGSVDYRSLTNYTYPMESNIVQSIQHRNLFMWIG